MGMLNQKKIKKARLEAGLTFGKFADALQKYEPKASKALIWNWENGKRNISSRYMIAIQAVLKKDFEYFLT